MRAIVLFFQKFDEFRVDEGRFLVGLVWVDKVVGNFVSGRKFEGLKPSIAKTAPIRNNFRRHSVICCSIGSGRHDQNRGASRHLAA
jgi:hypothetical protein